MDIEKLKTFLDLQVRLGKITREKADEKVQKHIAKNQAIETYKSKKASLTKAEMQALLDILTS